MYRVHVFIGSCGGACRGLDLKRRGSAKPRPMSPPPLLLARSFNIGEGDGPLHHFFTRRERRMTTRRNFTRRRPCGRGSGRARGRARATQKWRMVTSWPKRLPGPGMSAERIAERSARCRAAGSTSRFHAAGEIVPAFEVLDAVGNGVADIGHTAAFYWQGKMPAAAFFTTVPFGLTPDEHVAWVDAGGGQALWDELYAPFGVKPFMGGNTGVCMGGWFRREIKSLADVRGLKLRSLGLGGEIYRRLGVTPQTTPPAEILVSLQSGVIDGAEFVGPGTDIALGLYRVAPFYYYPGFNKPNGTGECIVSLQGLERARRRAQGDRRACLRDRGEFRARRDGTAQRPGARRAGDEHKVKLAAFPEDSSPPRASRRRRARRARRPQRHHRKVHAPTRRSAIAPRPGRGSRSNSVLRARGA